MRSFFLTLTLKWSGHVVLSLIINKEAKIPKGFPGGSALKNLPANAGDVGLIPGLGNALEKEMATHSSIIAWEIPWTEEPGSPWGHKESDTTERTHTNTHKLNMQ